MQWGGEALALRPEQGLLARRPHPPGNPGLFPGRIRRVGTWLPRTWTRVAASHSCSELRAQEGSPRAKPGRWRLRGVSGCWVLGEGGGQGRKARPGMSPAVLKRQHATTQERGHPRLPTAITVSPARVPKCSWSWLPLDDSSRAAPRSLPTRLQGSC